MYREERKNTKRNRERDRQDPVKTQKPMPGSAAASGPGSGGVLGSTGGTLLTQYILKNHVRCPSKLRGLLTRACSEPLPCDMLASTCLGLWQCESTFLAASQTTLAQDTNQIVIDAYVASPGLALSR